MIKFIIDTAQRLIWRATRPRPRKVRAFRCLSCGAVEPYTRAGYHAMLSHLGVHANPDAELVWL